MGIICISLGKGFWSLLECNQRARLKARGGARSYQRQEGSGGDAAPHAVVVPAVPRR